MSDWLEMSDKWHAESGLSIERPKKTKQPSRRPNLFEMIETKQAKLAAEREVERRRRRNNTPSLLFLATDEWKAIRAEAIALYGPVCMKCGSIDHIQVDHIKPRHRFPDLSLDIDNLQILCWSCNKEKGYHRYDDYRPKVGESLALSSHE